MESEESGKDGSHVMRMEYMSSEETRKVRHYKKRKLFWESRELRRTKKKLDKNHEDSLPGFQDELCYRGRKANRN